MIQTPGMMPFSRSFTYSVVTQDPYRKGRLQLNYCIRRSMALPNVFVLLSHLVGPSSCKLYIRSNQIKFFELICFAMIYNSWFMSKTCLQKKKTIACQRADLS